MFTLKMATQSVPETLENFHNSTQPSARKDFIGTEILLLLWRTIGFHNKQSLITSKRRSVLKRSESQVIQVHYPIWQISVAASCRLVIRINVSSSLDRPYQRQEVTNDGSRVQQGPSKSCWSSKQIQSRRVYNTPLTAPSTAQLTGTAAPIAVPALVAAAVHTTGTYRKSEVPTSVCKSPLSQA